MGTVVSFQYKSDLPLSEGLSSHTTSVRLQENGFCIALHRASDKSIYLIEQHDFDGNYTIREKLAFLWETAKKWETGKACMTVCSRINSQVPAALHSERNQDFYLPLLTEEPYNYQIFTEEVKPYGLWNISGWNKNLYAQLREQFPQYRLRSEMYVLLQLLSGWEGRAKLLLFLEKNYLRLVAEKDGKLLGANGFEFNNKNDFLYYSVGFAQTLFGGLEGVELDLTGDIEPSSLLYVSLQKYFTNIHFPDTGHTSLHHQLHRFCDLLYEED